MAPPPGCPGGGRTKEGLGGVGRGGVGVNAGFRVVFPLMGRNSFAFGFRVEFFTCAAAMDSASDRSLPSGVAASSLLEPRANCVSPEFRPPAPVD